LHQDQPSRDVPLSRDDQAARRILNLLFLLNVSRAPLTTEQILAAEELGYGSANRESALRKFRRDREKLAEQGVIVREIHPAGSPQTEASLWSIDREATHADLGLIRQEDAETLLDIVDAHLRRSDIPYRGVLERIRVKALEALRADPSLIPADSPASSEEEECDPVLETIWASFALRRRLPFTYRDAAGRESERSVAIYGIFTLEGRCYFVGEEGHKGVRTFRADRVMRAGRPRGSYVVPADFDIDDHLFLPFDFAPGEGTEVVFSIDGAADEQEIKAVTRGRGVIEGEHGRLRWRITARDLGAACAWALAHRTSITMLPHDPPELIDAWNDLVRKAVETHA